VVLSRAEACARFAGAPPSLVPGIGPKTSERLARAGLGTLAAVARAPEAALAQLLGPNLGREVRNRARFEGGGALGAPRKSASESRERTFDHDLRDPAQMREALARMAEQLCLSLAAKKRRGRTIAIKVRLDDFTTITRARTLPEATCDAGVVGEVALQLLADYSPTRPVRLLGVRVGGLGASAGAGADPDAVQSEAGGARSEAGPRQASPGGAQLGLPV
jgi:DNA polymerase IV